MRKILCTATAVLVTLLSTTLPAQDTQPKARRPKIGLVLNGGGALGLAHVGALEWMDEHHIPVDEVAGTSMGGLIGAAYSTGMSPKEIHQFLKGVNWDRMISDTTPYRDMPYRRKEDVSEYPAMLQFGYKKGLRFAEGYKSGNQIQLLLDKIALPYSQVSNFDDLPTPFACVATDLVSGKPHVFRSGSLAMAMRATMSLPGIFAPVRTDNAIYADGGLSDNLPVDVAKQMGADVTIAIYLQGAGLKPDEKLTTLGVLGRSVGVMIAANELHSIEQADVLVSVPLEDTTAMDYQKTDAIIRRGYEAAQKKAAVLERFAVDDATWQAYLKERDSRKRAVPVPQFIAVTGVNQKDAVRIQEQLADNLNKPIQPDLIARQLAVMNSTQRVGGLSYGLTEKDGTPGLLIGGNEEPFGRLVFRPLLLVDGWDYQNVTLSVGARMTAFDLGGYGSELRTDGLFGSELLLRSEYFRPVDTARRWFLAPRLYGDDAPLELYSDSGLIAEYRNRRLGGGMDIGHYFGRAAEARFGYESDNQKLYPDVGDPTVFPRINGREGDTHLRFRLDRFDDPITPMKGSRVEARAEWWDAKPTGVSSVEFPLAELSMLGFAPVTSKSSFYLGASGGTTLWKNPDGLPPFSLGGSFHLPAYNTNELLTNQYFLFQGGYARKLGALSPLAGGRVLAFAGADVGKAYYLQGVSHLPSDVAGGLMVNTLLGPITLGAAVGDSGHYKFFFQIGRAYF
ncbi:patatin-like phospholipase family protein [Silvibacterium acidisoli]|uniref:patatin-like phospholipase family protein n=1 Tax=Acidobacteriaceae bacterium ZG23-2 TaxID=2883246 RepID=UPI00406C6571